MSERRSPAPMLLEADVYDTAQQMQSQQNQVDNRSATLQGGAFNGIEYDHFRVTHNPNSGAMRVTGVNIDDQGQEVISSLGRGASPNFLNEYIADAEAGLAMPGELVRHADHRWYRHNIPGEVVNFSDTEHAPAVADPEDGFTMVMSAKGGDRFLFESATDGEGSPAWKITQHIAGGENRELGTISATDLPPVTIDADWEVDLPAGHLHLKKVKRMDVDKNDTVENLASSGSAKKNIKPRKVDSDPWAVFRGASASSEEEPPEEDVPGPGGAREPSEEEPPEEGTPATETPEEGTPEPETPEEGTPATETTEDEPSGDEPPREVTPEEEMRLSAYNERIERYERARNEYAMVLAEESAGAFKRRKSLKERKEAAREAWLATSREGIFLAGLSEMPTEVQTEYAEIMGRVNSDGNLSSTDRTRLELIYSQTREFAGHHQDVAVFREAYYLEEAKRKFAGAISERGPQNKFLAWWAKRPDSEKFGNGKFGRFLKKTGVIAVPAIAVGFVLPGAVVAGAAAGTGMALHSITKRYRKLRQRSEEDAGRNVESMFRLNANNKLAADSPSIGASGLSEGVENRNAERRRKNAARLLGSAAVGATAGAVAADLIGNLIDGSGSEGSSLPDSAHRPYEVPDAGLNGSPHQPPVELSPGANGGENALVPETTGGDGVEVAIERADVFNVEPGNGIPHEVRDALRELGIAFEPGQETEIYNRLVEEFGKDNILQQVEATGTGTFETVGTGADATYIMGPNTNYAGNVGIQNPGPHMWQNEVHERIIELAKEMGRR
jgi:hypothetical protein